MLCNRLNRIVNRAVSTPSRVQQPQFDTAHRINSKVWNWSHMHVHRDARPKSAPEAVADIP